MLGQALLEPVISSIDSGRSSAGHCLRRSDPFSHPSGSSALPGCFAFSLKASPSWSFLRKTQAPNPRRRIQKNVQFRSVFIQFVKSCGFASGSLKSLASNPFLTHGAVESPKKLSPSASLL
jgi:hypothetical protein